MHGPASKELWSPSEFWEWDPVSVGWVLRDMGDLIYDRDASYMGVAYDSLRRRQILARGANNGSPIKTWELDTKAPTLYQRVLFSAPKWPYAGSGMTFDGQRGVVVFFGRLFCWEETSPRLTFLS
jgi:hypothetical protein